MYIREFKCPYCNKKSMWIDAENNAGRQIAYYKNGKKEGQAIRCPKCGMDFAILKGILKGIPFENVSNEYKSENYIVF